MIWLSIIRNRHGHTGLADHRRGVAIDCNYGILFFFQRKIRPYLIVGWLWFLGTLVPVIGLVQVGGQPWRTATLYSINRLFIAIVFD